MTKIICTGCLFSHLTKCQTFRHRVTGLKGEKPFIRLPGGPFSIYNKNDLINESVNNILQPAASTMTEQTNRNVTATEPV